MSLKLRGEKWVILCEGSGDEAFFRKLIDTRKLPDFFVTYPGQDKDPDRAQMPGGRSGFSVHFRGLRATPGFDKVDGLLIVSDNDDDPEKSFKEVQKQIRQAEGYGVPSRPLKVVKKAGYPAVVIMMMPRAGEPGNLETLCLCSMYDRWPKLKNCLDAFCQCTSTTSWGESKQSKMRLRAMIAAACKEDPNTSLTFAWSRRVKLIPLNHICFNPVANFLSDFGGLVAGS